MNTQAAGVTFGERHSQNTELPRKSGAVPQAGDVLVSARSARADVYAISLVPAVARLTVTRYAEAIEKVRDAARGLRVDGWFTRDHTHYVRVAHFRESQPHRKGDLRPTADVSAATD